MKPDWNAYRILTDAANGVLKNVSILVPLKYLSNFWRSHEMPLINCILELKRKWTKYCVLSVGNNENKINEDADANNIIFTIKNTKLYVLVVTLSAKINQKLSNLLAKDLKDRFIGINIKEKVIIKIQQMNLNLLLESIDYLS